MWRAGFQRRKTKFRSFARQSGQVQLVMGLFFLMLFALLLLCQIQRFRFASIGIYMEDALAASNLASAVIDVEEYGKTHRIVIVNPLIAFERYCVALKGNLALDDAWRCENEGMISGLVQIENYTIYNVAENQVTSYQVHTNGTVLEQTGKLGEVKAPNGTIVEGTSVYSAIQFPVRGMWDMEVMAKKGKLVDVVRDYGE